MKLFKYIIAITLLILGSHSKADRPQDEFCGVRNTTTQNSEQLTYYVYYNIAGIYVNAGTALLTNTLEKLNGKSVFHVIAEGKTNPSYDWIYNVRDRYETFIDTLSMQPLKFIRNINEGGYKNYENVSFSRSAGTAVTNEGVFKVPPCIQDVISAVYYARNIDFNKYNSGDKIPFKMFLDHQVYDMYIRYLGRDEVKTKYGKFKAFKFKPLLVKGNIFEGGEKMTIWVSDDENKIIIRAESPIAVGSVKVDMMSYRNLRYPLSGLKKLKNS
ncbi:MAG: DUF3108 domain-containing protein [Flavisolibacter sp.]